MNLTDIMLFGEAIIGGGGGSGGGASGGVIVYDGNKEYEIVDPEAFPAPKLSDAVLTESQLENAYIILDGTALSSGAMLTAIKPVVINGDGILIAALGELNEDGAADGFVVISEEISQMIGTPSGTYFMPNLMYYDDVKVWLCWE